MRVTTVFPQEATEVDVLVHALDAVLASNRVFHALSSVGADVPRLTVRQTQCLQPMESDP